MNLVYTECAPVGATCHSYDYRVATWILGENVVSSRVFIILYANLYTLFTRYGCIGVLRSYFWVHWRFKWRVFGQNEKNADKGFLHGRVKTKNTVQFHGRFK